MKFYNEKLHINLILHIFDLVLIIHRRKAAKDSNEIKSSLAYLISHLYRPLSSGYRLSSKAIQAELKHQVIAAVGWLSLHVHCKAVVEAWSWKITQTSISQCSPVLVPHRTSELLTPPPPTTRNESVRHWD